MNNFNDGEYFLISANMFGVVKYTLYHGPFEVKMAANGVDLSDFYNEEVDVPPDRKVRS